MTAGRQLPLPTIPGKAPGIVAMDPYAECHCVVIDGRWRRQADHCPQHVDRERWEA